METEHKIFFMKMKMFYIYQLINIPYYPGTGSEQEKGKFNNIFNIPLPAGTSSEEYLNAFDRVLKKLKEFKPEFVFFSAGFDAHEDDPLAQLNLKTKIFIILQKELRNN